MDERVYWIWLGQALGAGAVQGESLLETYHTAKAVYEQLSLPFEGLTAAQQKRLKDKDLSRATRELAQLVKLGGWVLTPVDAGFASLFEGMYAPPVRCTDWVNGSIRVTHRPWRLSARDTVTITVRESPVVWRQGLPQEGRSW